MADRSAREFGERVELERARRWRTRREFARHFPVAERTLAAIENGERSNFSAEIKATMERALGWEIGDFDRVRAGQEPNRKYPPDLVQMMDLWPALSPDARRMLVRLAREAVSQTRRE